MRLRSLVSLFALIAVPAAANAQNGNFVPGSGTLLEQVGDNFEDESWDYVFNEPKSSEEQNRRQNLPLGKSTNGRWYEGAKRGQPDIVRRVETPADGLPGSTGALMIKSLKTGIPGQPSFKMQQEDFILNVQYRTGGSIPVAKSPSVTTRIYLPPTEEWERRSGPHFAFRVALETTKKTPRKVLFMTEKEEDEVYWPGLFICMDTKEQTRKDQDHVFFRIRSNGQGGDVRGPDIASTGWWTLGISVSSNGAVHYYARPGIDDLTSEDYITSQYPYNYRAETFRSAFFNIVNADNGKSWTSTLIIDDTYVFLGTTPNYSSSPAQMAKRNTGVQNTPAARTAQMPGQSKRLGSTGTSQTPATAELSDDSAYYR